jgi:hypothetical protein
VYDPHSRLAWYIVGKTVFPDGEHEGRLCIDAETGKLIGGETAGLYGLGGKAGYNAPEGPIASLFAKARRLVALPIKGASSKSLYISRKSEPLKFYGAISGLFRLEKKPRGFAPSHRINVELVGGGKATLLFDSLMGALVDGNGAVAGAGPGLRALLGLPGCNGVKPTKSPY